MSGNPLKIHAQTCQDLAVISAFMQNARIRLENTSWSPEHAQFVAVVDRFCWENEIKCTRVRTGIHVDNVISVKGKGINFTNPNQEFSIIMIIFETSEDNAGGILHLLCKEGIEIILDVEYLEVHACDMTQPWDTDFPSDSQIFMDNAIKALKE